MHRYHLKVFAFPLPTRMCCLAFFFYIIKRDIVWAANINFLLKILEKCNACCSFFHYLFTERNYTYVNVWKYILGNDNFSHFLFLIVIFLNRVEYNAKQHQAYLTPSVPPHRLCPHMASCLPDPCLALCLPVRCPQPGDGDCPCPSLLCLSKFGLSFQAQVRLL